MSRGKSKNTAQNTLPDGAPSDGYDPAREAAAEPSEAADAPSPEAVEAQKRVLAAELRAAQAEEKMRDLEMKLNAIAAGSGSTQKVAQRMKEIEELHAANRMIRTQARQSLQRRKERRPEDLDFVLFVKPWKRGVYQPDGKMYSFTKALAAKLVAAGVARYPTEKARQAEIERAEMHVAESIAMRDAMLAE